MGCSGFKGRVFSGLGVSGGLGCKGLEGFWVQRFREDRVQGLGFGV